MRDLLPFLKLYKKHWFSLSLGMLLALLTLLASIGLLTLSGWFLSAAAVAGLSIARETFNYMLPSAFVRGFAIGRTAGRWGERVVSHDATFKLLTDLRVFFFKRLIPLIPGRHAQLRDADLLNRLVADVDAMDHVYLRLISPVIVGLLGIFALSALVGWFDLTLGLTLGAILLGLLLSWPILFYQLGKGNGQALTEHLAQMRITTLDWLQGYSELTLFGAQVRYRQRIEQAQERLLTNQRINAHFTGLASGLLLLANGWALVLILWLAADGIQGQLPDPIIAIAVFATMASIELLLPIAGAFQHLGQTLSSARRLNEILLAEPEVQFPTQKLVVQQKLDIDFQHIQFYYPEQTQAAIRDLSLHIPYGHKMALVGKTGSGKSTLLQLLCRYWDVQQGQIQLAGQPLTAWNESQLREAISVVSQRVDILNASLEDNLTLARPQASEAELTFVLQQVGLAYLLHDQGLNTWLGDGGRQLSGGEKRRIGIARALLHDAPIILLDEPTEGLDKQTEQQIMTLFEQLFTQKTVVFITHRLVHLEKMDTIALLEQGELVEYGDHISLLAQQGRYYQLHQKL